jgi:5-(carboxyamino)imidazole ribonucleotide mutase
VNGAENAGLLAAQIVGLTDPAVARKVEAERQARREKVLASDEEVRKEFTRP